MGNKNGIADAIMSRGKNNTIRISKNWYFSFAFGNEIALVGNGDFYILNCGKELWDKVAAKISETKNVDVIIKWWCEQAKHYETSYWSGSFTDLEHLGD